MPNLQLVAAYVVWMVSLFDFYACLCVTKESKSVMADVPTNGGGRHFLIKFNTFDVVPKEIPGIWKNQNREGDNFEFVSNSPYSAGRDRKIVVEASFKGMSFSLVNFFQNSALSLQNKEMFQGMIQTPSEIRFRWCELEEIPGDIFRGLRDLVTLDLSNNRLVSLDNGTFKDLESLKHLILEQNRLECLYGEMFAPLRNLVYLSCYGNSLEGITPQTFAVLQDINEILRIDMSRNPLKRLPYCEKTVRGLTRSRGVDMIIGDARFCNSTKYRPETNSEYNVYHSCYGPPAIHTQDEGLSNFSRIPAPSGVLIVTMLSLLKLSILLFG